MHIYFLHETVSAIPYGCEKLIPIRRVFEFPLEPRNSHAKTGIIIRFFQRSNDDITLYSAIFTYCE